MRLALIQTRISYGDAEKNLRHICELVEEAAQKQPDLIVLPEMWNVGFGKSGFRGEMDKAGFPCAREMGHLSKMLGVNIVAGSVADERDDKTYNTTYVFDRQGSLKAQYDKIHLFGLMGEGETITAGYKPCRFSLDGIECGGIICYDLRFPELSRTLALGGMQLLIVPAQWPKPRLHPWRTLLQARAIENQIFVAGVNCAGRSGGYDYFGHSMIVDPLGEVIREAGETETILCADINLAAINQVRSRMDCLRDRVPRAYVEEVK